MLGEFFAAREDELDVSLVEEGPLERFEKVEAKTVSEVSIATLGEILGAGSYDELIERAAPESRQAQSGEAGIDAVVPEIQEALVQLSDRESVAEQWGATDEMTEWPAGDVLVVVGELADLARRAAGDGRRLWFWWSL